MIITLNTRSEFIPGTLIIDKEKGVYGVVLYGMGGNGSQISPINAYKVKSLNMSKYWLIRKFQLFIIKNVFK